MYFKMVVEVFGDQSDSTENKMVPGYKMDVLAIIT